MIATEEDRQTALNKIQFSEDWNRLILAAAKWRFENPDKDSGAIGGLVSISAQAGLCALPPFTGIDVQQAVLDTYEKIRFVGVPVVWVGHGQPCIATGQVTDSSALAFNATISVGLPDCSGLPFSIYGYNLHVRRDGEKIRFSIAFIDKVMQPPVIPLDGLSNPKMFSFRADCVLDVDSFKAECVKAGLDVSLNCIPNERLPDVVVELKTEASLDYLQAAMRQVVDGHVMLQTLRECPLADNSLERDYDLT